MMAYTPEPWTIEIGDDNPWVMVNGADGFPVADCLNYVGFFARDDPLIKQAIENANLIHAAPNLLAACGSALWVINNLHNHSSEIWADFAKEAEKDLRAAIAKAKGEG